MVRNASAEAMKYRVKRVSPGRFSWGMTLSAMHTTRVPERPLTKRRIVPRAGPMKGSQYRTTTRSGRILRSISPVRIQFSGFTEWMQTRMSRSFGAGSDEYCVVPGKRKPGYCRENVRIVTRWPVDRNWRASRSLKLASPPRSGCAGPMMTTEDIIQRYRLHR